MTTISHARPMDRGVRIRADGVYLEGDWSVPIHPQGVVILVHGAGGSRFGSSIEARFGLTPSASAGWPISNINDKSARRFIRTGQPKW